MLYLFEGCALDTDRRELRREASLVPLEPQVFDLLEYLVRNRTRVVSKDDLLAAIWGGRIVSESALTTRLNAARHAIGDSGEAQRLIKTLPRKGVRFVGEVCEQSPATHVPAGAVVPLASTLPLPEKLSIAVLPFTNMGGDPDQEHIADGIAEDLITSLCHIQWLFVIARNSSFSYRGHAVDLKQVSRELGVRYVLEGSVRRDGNRFRITVQLADATSGQFQWAERYDRELQDIFALQDEITASVAAAIEPRLLAADGTRALTRSPADLDAWGLVARARGHFWNDARPNFQAAIDMLKGTIDTHPEYAPAYSLLAFFMVFAAHMGWVDHEDALSKGRDHALQAIQLDDADPWAHIALGYLALMERRTDESITSFRRALSLNPNSAVAHSHLSRALAFAGHYQEAIEHGEEALRLSPLDAEKPLFLGALGVAHYMAGRFSEAVACASEALKLRPGLPGAQCLLCASLAQAGRLDEAREVFGGIRKEQPLLSIDWVQRTVPFQTPELMERFLAGMRKVGLPEN